MSKSLGSLTLGFGKASYYAIMADGTLLKRYFKMDNYVDDSALWGELHRKAKRCYQLRRVDPMMRCAYCRDDWIPGLQFDHIDGNGRFERNAGIIKDTLGNVAECIEPSLKYQILCATCNFVKRNLSDEEFRAKYPERIKGD